MTPYAHLCPIRQISHARARARYRAFLLGSPIFLLCSISPSASHLLALTSCTTLMICLPAMTGNDTAARIHGTVLSILFALCSAVRMYCVEHTRLYASTVRSWEVRDQGEKTNLAISIAPALNGVVHKLEGEKVPSFMAVASEFALSSPGDSVGDENDRRYSAMKKSSLSAQKMKSVFCVSSTR